MKDNSKVWWNDNLANLFGTSIDSSPSIIYLPFGLPITQSWGIYRNDLVWLCKLCLDHSFETETWDAYTLHKDCLQPADVQWPWPKVQRQLEKKLFPVQVLLFTKVTSEFHTLTQASMNMWPINLWYTYFQSVWMNTIGSG